MKREALHRRKGVPGGIVWALVMLAAFLAFAGGSTWHNFDCLDRPEKPPIGYRGIDDMHDEPWSYKWHTSVGEHLSRIDERLDRLERREIDTALVRLHIQNYCIKPVGQVSLHGTPTGNRVEVEGFRVPCE